MMMGDNKSRKIKRRRSNLAATGSLLFHRSRSRGDVDAANAIRGGRRWTHPVLDLGSHRHKRLFYVGRVLGRRFEEGNAQLFRVFLQVGAIEQYNTTVLFFFNRRQVETHFGSCIVDHLLGAQVTLVAHKELVDILASVAVNLL